MAGQRRDAQFLVCVGDEEMTCIIGLVENGKVYMGGDSAAGDQYTSHAIVTHPKIFINGDFLIGYTTSFRMGQLLEHHLTVEPKQVGMSDMAYMVRVFIEATRKCFKKFAFAEVENNQETGGQFLVGYNGNLYEVHSNFQVNQWKSSFWACGCGFEQALVAMHLLRDLPARDRIEQALAAVAEFSRWVAPPLHILEMGNN